MNKLGIILALLLSSCVPQPKYRVEQVLFSDSDYPNGFGNAFVVGYSEYGTILATARHVVVSGTNVWVKTSENSAKPQLVKAEVVMIHPAKDVAYVHIWGKLTGKYETCTPQVHEQVIVPVRWYGEWDHTRPGTGYRVERGFITALDNDAIVMSLTVYHGYSGAPIISADRGCVVGLVSAKISNSGLSVGTAF